MRCDGFYLKPAEDGGFLRFTHFVLAQERQEGFGCPYNRA